MNIIVKKLSKELVEDYLNFFDTTPHSTNKEEHRCYCVCWAADDCEGKDFSTAEKRRTIAMDYVEKGYIQGYLAYYDNKVVGWCNANDKAMCYNCMSWKMFMQHIRKVELGNRVKSIFCFAVAPHMRGKGIATALLRFACNDAIEEGFDAIEAYPNKEFLSTEEDFMGTVGMFEKALFVREYQVENKLLMKRKLK